MSGDPRTAPSTILDPYGVRLHYAWTQEQWARIARKFEDDPGHPGSMGVTSRYYDTHTHQRHYVVWVDMDHPSHQDDPAQVVATLAHEAYHVATGLLYDLRHRPETDTDEPTAYLLEYVLLWLMSKTPDHPTSDPPRLDPED